MTNFNQNTVFFGNLSFNGYYIAKAKLQTEVFAVINQSIDSSEAYFLCYGQRSLTGAIYPSFHRRWKLRFPGHGILPRCLPGFLAICGFYVGVMMAPILNRQCPSIVRLTAINSEGEVIDRVLCHDYTYLVINDGHCFLGA